MKHIVIIAVMSCSGATDRAPEPITHEVHADTATIKVHRAMGTLEGDGTATLAAGLDAQHRARHSALAAARAWLQIARSAADPIQAYEAAHHGVDELGADYAPQGAEDDSSVHLYLAEMRAKDHEYTMAASAAARVLEARIHMYVRRYQDEVQ